jgi:hypothetical protein
MKFTVLTLRAAERDRDGILEYLAASTSHKVQNNLYAPPEKSGSNFMQLLKNKSF